MQLGKSSGASIELRRPLAVTVLGLVLSACASHGTQVEEPEEVALRHVVTISVDDQIDLPKSMMYMTLSKRWGNAFAVGIGGAIGGAIGGSIIASGDDHDKAHLAALGIDIAAIYRANLIRRIQDAHLFRIVTGPADAHLHLKVDVYGFKNVGAFNGDLKTVTEVAAQLTIANGMTVWRDSENDDSAKNQEHKADDLWANPSLLYSVFNEGFAYVSQAQVADLVNSLGEKRVAELNWVSPGPADSGVTVSAVAVQSPESTASATAVIHTLISPAGSPAEPLAKGQSVRLSADCQLRGQPKATGNLTQLLPAGTSVMLDGNIGDFWFVKSSVASGWLTTEELR